MGTDEVRQEFLRCRASPHYFIHNYVHIYDATEASWIPFELWPLQAEALYKILDERLVIILKARQLGMTWLVLAYILYKMIFYPEVTALVFSRRDDEATYLLDRMRNMYKRLPRWMQARNVLISNAHIWSLSNGSIAYGFPTTAGDSYTATIAVVDEADLVPDLDKLMNAVKPTIDGGGEMILLSRSNKDNPGSPFKRMYVAARDGKSPWKSVFLPWHARPSRTREWYEQQADDILTRTGSLDDLYQQYPEEDVDALRARVLDKRVPPEWLDRNYIRTDPTEEIHFSGGVLEIYEKPDWKKKYIVGADPAEGNPTSDDSSMHVMDTDGNEVAKMSGKIQPVPFAITIAEVCTYYNNAPVLVERNNHGHAVIGYLTESTGITVLTGHDGGYGWHTTQKAKALMWTIVVEALRDNEIKIRSESTHTQIASIEGAKLKAPDGMNDDEAVSYALTVVAYKGGPDQTVSWSYT